MHSIFCDNDEIARYLDKRFKFPVDEFKYNGVEDIVSGVKATRFRLSLNYIVSDFATPGNNRNGNLRLTFFGSAKKLFRCISYIWSFFEIFSQ